MVLPLELEEQVLRALLLFTGLRVTPICGIRWGDVSFSATTFSSGLECPGSIRATSKGKKTSVKPMHPTLYGLLRDWWLRSSMEPKAYLFAQKTGRPWTRKTIERRARQWGVAAEVVDCHPHRFRHSFATVLIEQGADIRLVQQLLDPRGPVDDDDVHEGLGRADGGSGDGNAELPASCARAMKGRWLLRPGSAPWGQDRRECSVSN